MYALGNGSRMGITWEEENFNGKNLGPGVPKETDKPLPTEG